MLKECIEYLKHVENDLIRSLYDAHSAKGEERFKLYRRSFYLLGIMRSLEEELKVEQKSQIIYYSILRGIDTWHEPYKLMEYFYKGKEHVRNRAPELFQ